MTNAPAPAHFGNFEANLRFLDAGGRLGKGARILEIGSGGGALLHELETRGLEIVGVETSGDRIAEARTQFGDLTIMRVNGVVLPFPDESFDLVLSFDVFEHIPDSDAHLAEVRRVLRPGGWHLLQTPNRWSNTIFETIRWRSFTRWRADHCSLHSAGQLERRLRQHGFEPHFADVKVVTPFYREKVRHHLGAVGVALLIVLNPDRLPVRWRTNLYVEARKD